MVNKWIRRVREGGHIWARQQVKFGCSWCLCTMRTYTMAAHCTELDTKKQRAASKKWFRGFVFEMFICHCVLTTSADLLTVNFVINFIFPLNYVVYQNLGGVMEIYRCAYIVIILMYVIACVELCFIAYCD